MTDETVKTITTSAAEPQGAIQPPPPPKPTPPSTAFANGFVGTDVTEDTRTQDNVPFPVEDMYKEYKAGKRTSPFAVGYISSIAVKAYIKKDDYALLPGEVLDEGAKKPRLEQVTPESLRWVLEVHFVSKDGTYQHIHTIWDIQPDHKNPTAARRGTTEFFGHLWNQLSLKNDADKVLSASGVAAALGRPVGSWKDNFEGVAKIFNTGNNGQPIFIAEGQPLPIRIKLMYGQKGRVEMPLFGNKIERIISGMTASILSVGEKDKMVKPEKPSDGLANPAEVANENEPDWDNL